jgi:subtilisin family serine protease
MSNLFMLTGRANAAVRLFSTVALCLFVVGLVVYAQGTPTPPTIVASVEPGATQLAVPSNDVGDFYLYQGQRIPLNRSQDELGVRFSATLDPEAATAALQSVLPSAFIQQPGTPGTRGVFIVGLAPPDPKADVAHLAQEQLGQARAALNASAAIEFAVPVFINPQTGNKLLVTDEVVAKLRGGRTAAQLAERFAVTVVGPLWNTTDEYVLRLVDPRNMDPLKVANEMAASGLVEWAEPNFIQQYQKFAVPNDPLFPSQWHLNNTGQGGGTAGADAHLPGAWDVTTGSSTIVIAVIDDGAEMTHEDLAANIFTNPGEIAGDGIDNDGNGYIDDVHGWDFSNNDNDPSPMSVDDNHGTSVSGVAAARGNNGIGVSGACPNCRILPVKVFSPSFVGDTAAANAIRYAASFADVLNNSWGGGSPSSTIQSAIQWATTNGRGGKGSVVLFASGNSAGAFVTFSLSGIPAGTHGFRWKYAKDSSISSGDDTAWLAWVQFPGGERVNFESGSLPSGWTTGGNASWSVVTDRAHADEGLCMGKSAKAGTITHSQSTTLSVAKTVPAGTLVYRAWVSSEASFDKLTIDFSLNNTGSYTSYLARSGVPAITTDVAYPAAHPESIAVGASTDFDCRAPYSEYGPALAFVAPSNGGLSSITTTDRTGSAGYDTTSNYNSTFGGTSSATPLSSGIVGLLLSANPTLTVAQVRQRLQDTADKVGMDPYVSGRNDRYGYGRINAAAALGSGAPSITSLTPDVALPTTVGTPMTWTASTTGGTAPIQCKFWRYTGGTWTMVQNYSAVCTYPWTPTAGDVGTNAVEVWVRSAGSTSEVEASRQEWFTVESGLSVTSLTWDPSPPTVGTLTTCTATATGGTAPLEYKFWKRNPAGTWVMVQGWSTTNTYPWTPGTGDVGTNAIEVWVRSAGSSAELESSRQYYFNVLSSVAISGLTADVPLPASVGTPMTWTATATGGTAPLEYKFWRYSAGAWSMVQDYSTSNTYAWTPTSGEVGSNVIEVWVRSAGSTAVLEVSRQAACPVAVAISVTSLSPNVSLPTSPGTPMTWTATLSGGVAPVQYQFWKRNPAGTWAMVRDWSTTNTYDWTPGSGDVGVNAIEVWARNSGSTGPDASRQTWFGVASGVAISDLTATPSPVVAGDSASIVATASGGTAPLQYQFWHRNPSGVWTLVQDYSTSNTFTFTQTSGNVGYNLFEVWVRSNGSTAALEAARQVSLVVQVPAPLRP